VSRRPLLPNILVIGAAKSGTTSLAPYLPGHPQAYMPRFEPHYFTAERRWKLGQAWYENLFKEAGSAVAVAEKSASYSRYPLYQGVPDRIAALVPDIRIVYLVRHPLQRMRSEYLHRLLNGKESRSLVDTSRYALQSDRYQARRPIPRPLKRLLDASLHVGVSPRAVERLSYRSVATTVDQTRIVFSDQVRTGLEEELRDDVRRLRGYLDPEFDGWGIG
jgi:hypothetical protein